MVAVPIAEFHAVAVPRTAAALTAAVRAVLEAVAAEAVARRVAEAVVVDHLITTTH